MIKGLLLTTDHDFDLAIFSKTKVEITVGGIPDYTGKIYAYTDDYVLTEAGDRYLRLTCEFKTV